MTLQSEIKKLAKQWASEITSKAKTNLGDKVKLIAVSSKTTEASESNVSIEVTARNKTSNQWGVVKVARAYEQGSGIHGRYRKTYVIKPRKVKGLLAFPWEAMRFTMDEGGPEAVRDALQYSHKFVGFSDETDELGYPKYLFRYVDHPGVEAVNNGAGYMRPAIKSVRAKMNRNLKKVVGQEVKASIRKAFKK